MQRSQCNRHVGSPHARGDGPAMRDVASPALTFSPRAWGWSGPAVATRDDRARSPHVRGDGPPAVAGRRHGSDVLPTCVGMVRSAATSLTPDHSSPHARGDGPTSDVAGMRSWRRSPHVRGDGPRRRLRPGRRRARSPHARGDGPQSRPVRRPAGRRSPHARGDGPQIAARSADHAGSSPHVRGDGPRQWCAHRLARIGSPHVRGDGPNMPTRRDAPVVVLPTCVGMVRTRGDVGVRRERFSPRAWGWSDIDRTSDVWRVVLPTCVGMVRAIAGNGTRSHGVLPTCVGMVRPVHRADPPRLSVLPTCVGMVRTDGQARRWRARSPHVRGDGPQSSLARCEPPGRFSPRAWGWSADRRGPCEIARAFSPRAWGWSEQRVGAAMHPWSSPHARGDGPAVLAAGADSAGVLPTCVGMVRPGWSRLDLCVTFSPRAWGWSEHVLHGGLGQSGSPHARGDGPNQLGESSSPPVVLPTCVGMVRTRRRSRGWRSGSPHARGDGPVWRATSAGRPRAFSPRAWGWSGLITSCSDLWRAFSPRAWGWSEASRQQRKLRRCSPHVRGDGPDSPSVAGLVGSVLPTCVGMVRTRA